MQNKLIELQTERHMKIFGLQIKALKIQEDLLKKPTVPREPKKEEPRRDETKREVEEQQNTLDKLRYIKKRYTRNMQMSASPQKLARERQ